MKSEPHSEPEEHLSLRFAGVSYSYPGSLFGKKPTQVFKGFSWETPVGSTVLLGPNGAGKTTLLSLGSNALRPSAGSVHLDGMDPSSRRRRAEFRRNVGWLPQSHGVIPGLTAREQVAYAGWLKGLPRAVAWTNAMPALERVGMAGAGNRLTSQLSGGEQRRVGLAQLLIHDASLLLLDEPTVGLDPSQRAGFRDLLRDLAQHAPIVVSTHQVDDLNELFQTVVILNGGTIRFEGSVSEFMAHAPAGSGYPAEAAYARIIGAT